MEKNDIRTSIDVGTKWLEKIEEYSKAKKISISDVINSVLDKYMKELADKPETYNRAMKYQARGTDYQSVHIRLSFISYSRLRDVMLVFRYSLSYMLSLAMEFFDEYMNESEKEFFPPSFHCSIISSTSVPKFFSNYWHFPPEEHLLYEKPFEAG
ncbi:MAG TPA: hypothetical protein P5123_00040 [Spirochaetota bacterium]|nr:hypothetical protein [Spirochaetota bacterium]